MYCLRNDPYNEDGLRIFINDGKKGCIFYELTTPNNKNGEIADKEVVRDFGRLKKQKVVFAYVSKVNVNEGKNGKDGKPLQPNLKTDIRLLPLGLYDDYVKKFAVDLNGLYAELNLNKNKVAEEEVKQEPQNKPKVICLKTKPAMQIEQGKNDISPEYAKKIDCFADYLQNHFTEGKKIGDFTIKKCNPNSKWFLQTTDNSGTEIATDRLPYFVNAKGDLGVVLICETSDKCILKDIKHLSKHELFKDQKIAFVGVQDGNLTIMKPDMLSAIMMSYADDFDKLCNAIAEEQKQTNENKQKDEVKKGAPVKKTTAIKTKQEQSIDEEPVTLQNNGDKKISLNQTNIVAAQQPNETKPDEIKLELANVLTKEATEKTLRDVNTRGYKQNTVREEPKTSCCAIF